VAHKYPELFRGMSLIAPYLGLYDPREFEKMLPILKLVNMFVPTYKIARTQHAPSPKWRENWE